ncbi:MAG TPA: hypothetical protein VNT26_03425, partial [Candidatus Sulfotelmatobacter sp.]|nr:hypothetical protein [Candidatus Sulfotelmatobacter sp.]
VVIRRARSRPFASRPELPKSPLTCPHERTCFLRRPCCWLAVKSRSLAAVQAALGLNNPKPCSWIEGLAGDEKLFIAPPIKGWVLVIGSGLPDPSEDVDACFRFISELSRKLGQVQFFSASRILNHHAWVKAEGGRVVRAYAWAGRTLWQQGTRTSAERELDLKCFGYTEAVDRPAFGQPDCITSNVDKVPLLAARWSLDPARIDERFLEKEHGIAGEPSRRF